MSRKWLFVVVIAELLCIVFAFLAGIVWYPHIHSCIVFSWHLTGPHGSTGSELICNP